MSVELAAQNEELQKLLGTTSFGKQSNANNTEQRFDQSKRAPPSENAKLVTSQHPGPGSDEGEDKDASQGDDSDEDEDDDDDDDEDEFPVSHELLLKTHDRPVTAVTIDPSGTRMITGSNDCTLKFHDFASMTPTTIRAFKSVDPSAVKGSANSETHPVAQVLFNPLAPGSVLVVTALPQARILSRDGETVTTFQKGDMYLRDMHNTKGHISEITSAAWHPTNRDLCVTAGTDSTLRIWDVKNPREQKHVIVHKSRAAGSAGRTRMTAVVWGAPSQGGNSILVAAALDGSLVMWEGEGPYHRPTAEIRDAHVKDTWTGGIDISPDGRYVVTRGGDNTIKLWDVRNFKKPISVVEHPSTSSQYPTSNIRFSPNGANIITGSETGHLHILNPATLRPELITPVTPGSSLITVLWHPKLNQIITGSANAETHVMYNPGLSTGGAKSVMLKAPKRRHIDDDPSLTMDTAHGLSGDSIIVPGGALPSTSYAARHPTVGLTASGRSRDPRRPHVPATTPFAKTNPDASYVNQSIPLSSMRDEDPREALLKYAEKAKNDPLFTNAWSKTQPKTQYAEIDENEDEDEGRPDKKKFKR